MRDPARAVIFGRRAETYDRARPGYPREAITHIGALVDAKAALEVAAGTGKATVDIARPGLRLTCLEPSSEMARILEERALPGAEVVVTSFEEWQGDAGILDLIYAAQAWHWVDPDIGYQKSLRLLRSGGVLALMWNVPLDRYGRFDAVYEEHAPGLLAEHDERIEKRDSVTWLDDMGRAGFEDRRHFSHEWSETLSPSELRALYSTYSDHMMLPADQREPLLDGLAAEVDRRGGEVQVSYRTNVFSGVVP
jgi:SAM-dependent methyltransferase